MCWGGVGDVIYLDNGCSNFVFQHHMITGLKSNTSPDEVLNTGPLFEQSVNNRGALGNQGCLEQVGQDGEDRGESSWLGLTVKLDLWEGGEVSYLCGDSRGRGV